jgi:transcriptional regulator with AAA-type ATPase domain
MAIESRRNPSDRSKDRTSLLMQMLIAEGPGTIIWKEYANDCVYDRSSHDLLRSVLTSYSFLPCPNAHFVDESKSDIGRLHCELENPSCKLSKIYARFSVVGREHIRRLNELANKGEKTTYFEKIRQHYYVSQTGPIVICGSPEAYYGYRKPVDRKDTTSNRSELEILLDECGYSEKFSIEIDWANTKDSKLKFSDGQESQNQPYGIENGYLDLGLLHVGRTSRNQLVVILAGVADDYGSYGITRMGMDSGRNEINSGLLDFFKNPKIPFSLISQLRPWTMENLSSVRLPEWRKESEIYHRGTPVDAKVIFSTSHTDCSVFEIAEWERKLADRKPSKATLRKESTRLAEYLAEIGPISVMAKAYPGQIQDDANAKDLLEYLLPDTHFIPALGNAPRDELVREYLRDNFNKELESTCEEDKSFLSLLEKVDECGADLIRSWVLIAKQFASETSSSTAATSETQETVKVAVMDSNESITETQSLTNPSPQANQTNISFFDFCLSYYRIDTRPLVILGAPESYLGYVNDSNSPLEASTSQLSEIVDSINYPNRYVQQWGADSMSILDRSMVADYPRVSYSGPDYGIVYLCRDPSKRVVLIIAGGTSRGTEAGLQLLLEERRADIDEAVQRFIEGEQTTVELAYRCLPAKIGPRYVVDVLTEELTREPKVNRLAIPFVEQMFEAVKNDQNKTIPIDECNKWHLINKKGDWKMTAGCKLLYLNQACKKHIKYRYFLSTRSSDVIHRISLRSADKTERLRVLLLGETGTGKEGLSFLIHEKTRPGKPFEYVNSATLTETILSSELFGTVEGAFTPSKNRAGFFETCTDGTVAIDELTLESSPLQVSLNHVLQTGEFRRVGDGALDYKPAKLQHQQCGDNASQQSTDGNRGHQIKPKPSGGKDNDRKRVSNAQIIVSTNFARDRSDFEAKMEKKKQRVDFGARFSLTLSVASLSERFPEIIPVFLDNYLGGTPSPVFITIEAIALLLQRPYKKNFRELQYITEKLRKEVKSSTDRSSPIRRSDILEAFDMKLDNASPSRKHGNRSYDLTEDTSAVVELSLEFEEVNLLNLDHDFVAGKTPELQFLGYRPEGKLEKLAICGHSTSPDPFAVVVQRLAAIKGSLADNETASSPKSTIFEDMLKKFETATPTNSGSFDVTICSDALEGLQMLHAKRDKKEPDKPLEFFRNILASVLRPLRETAVTERSYEKCINERRSRITEQQVTDIYNGLFDKRRKEESIKEQFRKCAFFLVTGFWPPEQH